MKNELLSEVDWKFARDNYAISSPRRLMAEFSWPDNLLMPRQLNSSDCGRSIAKFAMKAQGIKYPDMKNFRIIVNTGSTGIDMYDLELAMKFLKIDCESFIEVNAATIISELSQRKDVWMFSHQMLAGTYKQYKNMQSGHYALAFLTLNDYIYTLDSGICKPGIGKIHRNIYDKINYDNKIQDSNNVVYGYVMRIGILSSFFSGS